MQAERFLDPRMSIRLDLVRGGAALAVLIGHAGQIGLLGRDWPLDDSFQHAAVLVFFVLSGLMIQQSASRDGTTVQSFAVARLARILPVSTFAMLWSVGMFVCLGRMVPEASLPTQSELTPRSVLLPLLFASERLGGLEPPLNPPYWSLCYEWWFYALFGAWRFLRGERRILLVAGLAMAAGLPILLLLPVWLLGVGVGAHGSRIRLDRPVRTLALALLGFALASWSGLPLRVIALGRSIGIDLVPLRYSQFFLTDLLGGAFVALAFVALRAMPGEPRQLRPLARGLAGISFTLYLTHWPLLAALHVLMQPRFALLAGALALALPVLFAALLAPLLEDRVPRWIRCILQAPGTQGGGGAPARIAPGFTLR